MPEAPEIFAEIASIPTITSGLFTNSCEDFELSVIIRKYGEGSAKKANYLLNSKATSSVVEQSSDIKFRSFSPDGKVMLVGRAEGNASSPISIELWKDSSLLKILFLHELHGAFCLDEVFGSMTWSPSGSKFMYVAEKKRDEQKGFEKFIYSEHFGEKLSSITDPVICILDIQACNVDLLGIPDSIFPSQPVFADNQTIFFTGIEVGSKKLGMTYIYCRVSSIYCTKLDGDSLEIERVSDPELSCRSPISAQDGTRIVYLANSLGRSHFKCSQLVYYDVAEKSSHIIVDIVEDPKCGFPGIFTQRLPPQRFTSNVLISSCWFNDRPIISVNIKEGEVERLFSDFDGCFRILDCRGSIFLVLRTSPNCAGEVFTWDVEDRKRNNYDLLLISGNRFLEKIRNGIEYKIMELNQQVSIVLTKPKATAKQQLPLVILPHGGPNSVYSVDYILYVNVLVVLGYAVASINYTGSIGFGNRAITALEGNIGVRDVEDCFLCIELLLKTQEFDARNVWLMGGSHGGYLTAFLSAKYPDMFRGAILRNPVIDLPSMLVTSDIADWTFGQLGLGYDQLHSRSPSTDELLLMRERSPSNFYRSVKCPSLVMLGTQDLRVHHSQGLYWSNLLKSAGVKVQVMLFPDANHGLETADSEKFGFLAIYDFLSKN